MFMNIKKSYRKIIGRVQAGFALTGSSIIKKRIHNQKINMETPYPIYLKIDLR